MAVVDDARLWILRLFELEDREGRGMECERFETGCEDSKLPLSVGERVYGIYKRKFYFTPNALIVKQPHGYDRINWADVLSCSTRHGEGAKVSCLGLVGGTDVQVEVGELAKGWCGRISQLFHQLIEHHGCNAAFGKSLVPADAFFAAADSPYCYAPNLEPHPSIEQLKFAIDALLSSDNGSKAFFTPMDDCELVSNELVLATTADENAVEEFAERFGAALVQKADENTLKKVRDIGTRLPVWQVIWD